MGIHSEGGKSTRWRLTVCGVFWHFEYRGFIIIIIICENAWCHMNIDEVFLTLMIGGDVTASGRRCKEMCGRIWNRCLRLFFFFYMKNSYIDINYTEHISQYMFKLGPIMGIFGKKFWKKSAISGKRWWNIYLVLSLLILLKCLHISIILYGHKEVLFVHIFHLCYSIVNWLFKLLTKINRGLKNCFVWSFL